MDAESLANEVPLEVPTISDQGSSEAPTIVQVIVGGGIVFALGLWLGKFGAS